MIIVFQSNELKKNHHWDPWGRTAVHNMICFNAKKIKIPLSKNSCAIEVSTEIHVRGIHTLFALKGTFQTFAYTSISFA